MNIRDIRHFRAQWKNNQGYNMPNWDEHFIGSTHGEVSGFYKMVNGIVENIKADLTPKLQNAQDEQAIYEFLQNAADSGATECAIIFDENYFMVVNNGSPFTDKDVKAILNTFQGTKADKNQPENCDKIGRYGIGFKLAYRLIGKSDGVNELINDMAGPIIFSWNKGDQLTQLQTLSAKNSRGDAPWLFKIALACFPTGPNEKVKGMDFEETVLFQQEELNELTAFLEKQQPLLDQLNLERGSLFFLKFGEKKHQKLQDSLLNLEPGIGFALNNLKTLNKIILKDKIVEKYPVTFEEYSILPSTEDFERIDPEFPNCPISLKIGFPNSLEHAVTLKEEPSIYQFFPMRNEQHSLAFFIHGTSFAKITDRTRLDNQGEANKETLSYIQAQLLKNLTHYQANDWERYVLLYRSFLLSDKPNKYNSKMINQGFFDGIRSYISQYIPSSKGSCFAKELVIIKDTRLPIEPISFGIGKVWFYWTEDETIQKHAANSAKLGLRRWDLRKLLVSGDLKLINDSIQQFDNEAYQIFMSELKDISFDRAFMTLFNALKCFKFSNRKGSNTYLSINDLTTNDDTFLLNEATQPYQDILKQLGFSILELNTANYPAIQKKLERALPYLTNKLNLFQKITSKTANNKLLPSKKQALFEFLETLVDARRLKEVRLFSYQNGKPGILKSMIAHQLEVPNWLEDYKIHADEDSEALEKYYIAGQDADWYENIIYPNWETFKVNEGEIETFYQQVQDFFKQRRFKRNVTIKPYIFINDDLGFVGADAVYYDKFLKDIEDYDAFESAVLKLTGLYLPPKNILPYLEEAPFKTTSTTNTPAWRTLQRGLSEKIAELTFSVEEKYILFNWLNTILSTADFHKLKLIKNHKGDLQIFKNLLPPSEYPDWLAVYQVHGEEHQEALLPFLAEEKNIYSEIIHPNWADIIADKNAKKEYENLYKIVADYYEKAARKNKSLLNTPYIYSKQEKSFVSHRSVFYHKLLVESDNFNALKIAIEGITELSVPPKNILPYLAAQPFRTTDKTLSRTFKYDAVILNEKATKALLAFADAANENIFAFMVIEDNGDQTYTLRKKGQLVQYYLEKGTPRLHQAVSEVYGERYIPLATNLYHSNYRNKGLVTAQEIYKRLSNTSSEDVLSELIKQSSDTKLREKAFLKLDEIVFELGKTYNKDSQEHQLLQLFRNREANFTKLRQKIKIKDEKGTLWNLSEIGYAKTVTISIERQGKYELPLAQILPGFEAFHKLLDAMATQFPDFEAPTLLSRRIFYVNEEMVLDKVFEELKNNFEMLENAAQLAFMLLYARTQKHNNTLKFFKVRTMKGDVDVSTFRFFQLTETPFTNPSAILNSEVYQGIKKYLKLDDVERSFEYNDARLLVEPHFDKNTYYLSDILAETENTAEIAIPTLDFMFQQWQLVKVDTLTIIDEDGNNQIADFVPSKYIAPAKYAIAQEELPDWVNLWLGEEQEKLTFLATLGVNTLERPITQWRHYFLTNEGEVSLKLLNELGNNLQSTIQWMYQNDLTFPDTDERIQWVRRFYNKMPEINLDMPLPYIQSLEEEKIIYGLNIQEEGAYFYIEPSQITQIEERYFTTLEQVWTALREENIFISTVDLKGLVLPTSKPEPILDVEELDERATEWTADHYQRWTAEHPFKIYLFDGKMPWQLKWFDRIISHFEDKDVIQLNEQIYLNQQLDNLEEALFSITKSQGLTDQHLLTLLRYKNERPTPTTVETTDFGVEQNEVASRGIPVTEEIPVPFTPKTAILAEQPTLEDIDTHTNEGSVEIVIPLKDLPADMMAQLKALMEYAKTSRIVKNK